MRKYIYAYTDTLFLHLPPSLLYCSLQCLASLYTTCVDAALWATVEEEEEEQDTLQEAESVAPASWWSSATAADSLEGVLILFSERASISYYIVILTASRFSIALLGFLVSAC